MTAARDWSVVVVGGAGAMGRYAVRAIARIGSVSRLVIADKNTEFGQRLAAEVGPPSEFVEIDATDEDSLRRAFTGADVVCSTLGPFTIFGGPIMRAALESGCNYMDVDDDWQSTVEAFESDDLASSKNLTAIVGIGSSPGFSNLLAMFAVQALDEIENLYTGWNLSAAVIELEPDYPAPAAAPAAVEHWLLQCAGTIRIWEEGKYAEVAPVQREVLTMPEFGERTVYSMGHPEPITLPQAVPGLRRSLNFQVGPEWLLDYVRAVAAEYEAGRISLQEGARRLQNPPPQPKRSNAPKPRRLPYNWALAEGSKDGKPRSVMTFPNGEPAGRMGGHTGVPLAIAVEFLRRGKITGRGVLSPERAIDPRAFLAMYAGMLHPPFEDVDAAISRVEAERE